MHSEQAFLVQNGSLPGVRTPGLELFSIDLYAAASD